MDIQKPAPAPVVGKKIRQLRKDRHLTQAALASRMGIQQSDLCRMETGEYKVSLEALFKILRIFDMDIAEFFHEDLQHPASDTERDFDLLRQFRRLNEHRQDEVLEFVRYKVYQESIDEPKEGS